MKTRVSLESMEAVFRLWRDDAHPLPWNCLFTTPPWMKVWWESFQTSELPSLPAVWRDDELVGIAPIMITGTEAAFIGSSDVCDYLDFAVRPEGAEEFLGILTAYLRNRRITTLVMGPMRRDARTPAILSQIARNENLAFSCHDEDISLEFALPKTWDEFIAGLSAKERHETRRKLRRLHEAGRVEFRVVEGPDHVDEAMVTFLQLFKLSRPDKSGFMSDRMALFFRNLAREMAAWNLLRLMFLEIDGHPAASVLCFDHDGTLLLYNNGYDPRFRSLGVGLMSKILSIRYAIEQGRRRYDFLKGAERYKFRLGGDPVHICRCTMQLS